MSSIDFSKRLDVSLLIQLVGEDKIREYLEEDEYYIYYDYYCPNNVQEDLGIKKIRSKNPLEWLLFNEWSFLDYFFELALMSDENNTRMDEICTLPGFLHLNMEQSDDPVYDLCDTFGKLFTLERDGVRGYYVHTKERSEMEKYLWKIVSSFTLDDMKSHWGTNTIIKIYDRNMNKILPIEDDSLTKKYMEKWTNFTKTKE